MWKDYSISFIKKNRASTISIMVAAFIASLLLSLLCSFFYNMWAYDVESVKLEKGDWQACIAGNFSEEDLNLIRNFSNVEKAVVREEKNAAADSDKSIMEVDLYFYNPRTAYYLEYGEKTENN